MSDLYGLAQALDAVGGSLEEGARPPTWAVRMVHRACEDHFNERVSGIHACARSWTPSDLSVPRAEERGLTAEQSDALIRQRYEGAIEAIEALGREEA